MTEANPFGDPELETKPDTTNPELRKAKKAAEERAKEAEAELEKIRADLAAKELQERASLVATHLKEAGLPDKLAKMYPSEADVTPEAVKEWAVGDLGLETPKPTQQVSEEGETPWDRYDRFIRGSFAGEAQNELHDMLEKATRGVAEALGPAVRNNQYQPTPEEYKAAVDDAHAINRLHAEAEKHVLRGKAEPASGAFGGKIDPPYYANRKLQAMNDMR